MPFRIDYTANAEYKLCPSYPSVLVLPRQASRKLVKATAAFRTKQRFPILTWRSPTSGRVLCRSAEPGTLAPNREADKMYIDLIRSA